MRQFPGPPAGNQGVHGAEEISIAETAKPARDDERILLEAVPVRVQRLDPELKPSPVGFFCTSTKDPIDSRELLV